MIIIALLYAIVTDFLLQLTYKLKFVQDTAAEEKQCLKVLGPAVVFGSH